MNVERRSRSAAAKTTGPDPQRSAEARGTKGAFMPDGSWYPDADRWNDLTRFVNALVHVRRSTAESPAQLAARIARSPHADAFRADTVRHWLTLTEPWQWPLAFGSSCAEQTVASCGYGNLSRWHPDGWCECTCPDLFPHGLPSKPRDWPPAPTMTRDRLRAALDAIGIDIDRGVGEPPPMT